MQFEKKLRSLIVPEWALHYINYKHLKKLIKRISHTYQSCQIQTTTDHNHVRPTTSHTKKYNQDLISDYTPSYPKFGLSFESLQLEQYWVEKNNLDIVIAEKQFNTVMNACLYNVDRFYTKQCGDIDSQLNHLDPSRNSNSKNDWERQSKKDFDTLNGNCCCVNCKSNTVSPKTNNHSPNQGYAKDTRLDEEYMKITQACHAGVSNVCFANEHENKNKHQNNNKNNEKYWKNTKNIVVCDQCKDFKDYYCDLMKVDSYFDYSCICPSDELSYNAYEIADCKNNVCQDVDNCDTQYIGQGPKQLFGEERRVPDDTQTAKKLQRLYYSLYQKIQQLEKYRRVNVIAVEKITKEHDENSLWKEARREAQLYLHNESGFGTDYITQNLMYRLEMSYKNTFNATLSLMIESHEIESSLDADFGKRRFASLKNTIYDFGTFFFECMANVWYFAQRIEFIAFCLFCTVSLGVGVIWCLMLLFSVFASSAASLIAVILPYSGVVAVLSMVPEVTPKIGLESSSLMSLCSVTYGEINQSKFGADFWVKVSYAWISIFGGIRLLKMILGWKNIKYTTLKNGAINWLLGFTGVFCVTFCEWIPFLTSLIDSVRALGLSCAFLCLLC